MSRTIAIGDVHGCAIALAALIDAIDLQAEDTVVSLGDFVDRGPDSKGVLDQMLELESRCRLIPILGNHDQMMLDARRGRSEFESWIDSGGDTALDSYGSKVDLDLIPPAHFRFLESCRPFWETDTHLFLHANYKPDVPIEELDAHTLRWLSMRDYIPPKRHRSGKDVFVGHTPQAEILDLGYLIGIDTGACKGGWLTAIEVNSRETWQVNARGELRRQDA